MESGNPVFIVCLSQNFERAFPDTDVIVGAENKMDRALGFDIVINLAVHHQHFFKKRHLVVIAGRKSKLNVFFLKRTDDDGTPWTDNSLVVE